MPVEVRTFAGAGAPITTQMTSYDQVVSQGRARPLVGARVFVWVALAVLIAVVVAFVWLFVLGHGFDFRF